MKVEIGNVYREIENHQTIQITGIDVVQDKIFFVELKKSITHINVFTSPVRIGLLNRWYKHMKAYSTPLYKAINGDNT